MDFLIALLFLLSGELPQCTLEDGSTQQACVWSDSTGNAVLNIEHGTRWITLGGA